MFKNRIGEKFITNQGLSCEIIEYKNIRDCTIRFEDGRIQKVKYHHLKNHSVKNPYHKSVYGVGYLGEGTNIASIKSVKTSLYIVWYSLIQRCYDPIKQRKCPSYIGCTVCPEWHCFQTFATFYKENNPFNFQLDKDLLIKGNKIYSPETCCFIPSIINNSLIKLGRLHPKDLKKGRITKAGKYNVSICIKQKYIHIGNYNTPEEAYIKYKEAKENQLKQLAEEWKNKIDKKVYDALINYTVNL